MLLHYARRKPADEPTAPEPAAGTPTGSFASTGQQPATVADEQFTCQSIVKFLPRAGESARVLERAPLRAHLPAPGAIAGLILDADLIFSNIAAWCQSLAQLLTYVGHEPAGALQHRLWRNQHLADAFRGRREFGDSLESYLRVLAIPLGPRDEVLAASLSQWREGEWPLRLLPGVRKTLRRLSASGAKLAIVADSTVSGVELEGQLRAAGLGNLFGAVVTSVDEDRLLPDAELYRVALDRLGTTPGESMCVASPSALADAEDCFSQSCAFSEAPNRESGFCISRLEELLQLFDPHATLSRAS